MSHYEFMGLEPTCSHAEIKARYRELAMTMHPDKQGRNDLFQRLNEAQSVLLNPEKRKLYDLTLGVGKGAVGDGKSVFTIHLGKGQSVSLELPLQKIVDSALSSWNSVIQAARRFDEHQRQKRQEDMKHRVLEIKVDLSIKELFQRHTKDLVVVIPSACECAPKDNSGTCEHCSGTGITKKAVKFKLEVPLVSDRLEIQVPNDPYTKLHARVNVLPEGGWNLIDLASGTLQLSFPVRAIHLEGDFIEVPHLDGTRISVRCSPVAGTRYTVPGQGALVHPGGQHRGPLVIMFTD